MNALKYETPYAAQRDRPMALVLGIARSDVRSRIDDLQRRGYAVCFVDRADSALAVFATDMPRTAVIGPVPQTPCLDLLMSDLRDYGVPVSRVAALALA